MTKEQKAAFLEAAALIEQEPERYHQSAWRQHGGCGCLLSHVVKILKAPSIHSPDGFYEDVGLSSGVYWKVFSATGFDWPSPYRERLQKAKPFTKAYAKAGAGLLRAIARKGETAVFGKEREA